MPPWITTREAEELPDYRAERLRRMAREGWVRARKEGNRWLFDQRDLARHKAGWVNTREAADRTEYTQQNLRALARKGWLYARRVGKGWLYHWEFLSAHARGWMGLGEASEETGHSVSRLESLAGDGRVQARTVGGQTMLDREDLLAQHGIGSMSTTELYEILRARFSLGEIRTLCLTLGIDYESLEGQGKADKARELVLYVDLRGRVPDLEDAMREVRPDAFRRRQS